MKILQNSLKGNLVIALMLTQNGLIVNTQEKGDSFKTVLVDKESYFTQLVFYIHRNPVHHGLINKIEQWKHSSYVKIITEQSSLIKKNMVLDWFGGVDEFKKYHGHMIKDWKIENLMLE